MHLLLHSSIWPLSRQPVPNWRLNRRAGGLAQHRDGQSDTRIDSLSTLLPIAMSAWVIQPHCFFFYHQVSPSPTPQDTEALGICMQLGPSLHPTIEPSW